MGCGFVIALHELFAVFSELLAIVLETPRAAADADVFGCNVERSVLGNSRFQCGFHVRGSDVKDSVAKVMIAIPVCRDGQSALEASVLLVLVLLSSRKDEPISGFVVEGVKAGRLTDEAPSCVVGF